MSQILNLSRQRNQTLIFVTQEARQVDRNIASSATVIVFKEMGMLQPEFERPELRKLVGQAQESFESVRGDRRKWSFVYSPDADFVGPLENQLATFWKPGLSRLFVASDQTPTQRPAKRQTPKERAQKAKELRSQGRSLSEIADVLGVSKSTVFNYPSGPSRSRAKRPMTSRSPIKSCPPRPGCRAVRHPHRVGRWHWARYSWLSSRWPFR